MVHWGKFLKYPVCIYLGVKIEPSEDVDGVWKFRKVAVGDLVQAVEE